MYYHAKFQLKKNFFTVDEVAYKQYQRFKARVFESKYFQFDEEVIEDRTPDIDDVKKLIRRAMEQIQIADEKLS